MAQYLGTVKLGGFYNNGAALARPTKPWRNDTEPYSGAGRGNIPSMSGDISNYSFGNTPSDDAKKLQWVKIKDGDKTLLICVVNRHQIVAFQRIIQQFPGSFAYLSSVKETMGNFAHIKR